MDGYGEYCPIARGAEVFATRWTPLIVRNMLLGARTFTEIRDGVPGISKSLLAERLRVLEHHGVVERTSIGDRRSSYELTEAGRGLGPVCAALGQWGERWIELAPEHFDAHIVLCSLARQLGAGDLPERPITIRFELGGRPRERYWLFSDGGRAEICGKPPLQEDDLVLSTKPEWLTRWHVGELSLGEAIHRGVMRAEGPQGLVRMLARWGGRGSTKYLELPGAAPGGHARKRGAA